MFTACNHSAAFKFFHRKGEIQRCRQLVLTLSCLTFFLLLSASVSVAQNPVLKADGEDAADAPSVETITIEDAQLQLVVNTRVASRDAGVIESMAISEGTIVARGDVLVELNRDSFEAEFAGAKSELQIAMQESENDVDLRYAVVSEDVSRKVYQRSVEATKQFAKSVSGTELERLKLELERAKLSGEQAHRTQRVNDLTVDLRKALTEVAEIRLANRIVRSPVSGIVVQLYRQPGEWVPAGEPIARIIDTELLRVSCRCQLADASPDQIDKAATLVIDGNRFDANVVFTSPEIDPDIQDFLVWAEVKNNGGKLKPGMRGSIELMKRN